MDKYYLGISCYYHDSAVALLKNGEIVSAMQEERFSRLKQDSSFPKLALSRLLDDYELTLDDIEQVFYYEDPDIKFDRIFSTCAYFGIKGIGSFSKDIPRWLIDKKHVKRKIKKELKSFQASENLPEIQYVEHHKSHAASAFYPSPFESAAVLCIDGVGEWATTTGWIGSATGLKKVLEIRYPHSLGLLYSAFTSYCGFKVDSGEYKLMGLAPYGKPTFYNDIVSNLIDINEDGSYRLDLSYFDYATGNSMTSDKFHKLFGGEPREPESQLTEREFNLAASVQKVLEDVVIKIAKHLRAITGETNLCLSGGVALNCVSNGNLERYNIFNQIWAQPASGDSGGALGAALEGWNSSFPACRINRERDDMQGGYLGTSYDNDQIREYLDSQNAKYSQLNDEELVDHVSQLLSDGNVIGWFQGKMEYGPRALCNRSIIGDSRNPEMQTKMNLKIKNRESFRPFAPVVLEEKLSEWFETESPSPYMLLVHQVAQNKLVNSDSHAEVTGLDLLKMRRSIIPAVTHVDNSARIQSISRDRNPIFYQLLNSFYTKTGCPVLVNTSFNVRGEPIVESPANAYACFMRTEMDYLVLGNYVLRKQNQPNWEDAIDWKKEFKLD
ncbi:TPA: carbamoyltransferase [Vibrio cholerae]